MGGTIREHGGVLLAVNGTEDHVHLLLGLKQTITVADAVKAIKANSSRWVHQTFPGYRDFSWQGGYGAFTVSYSQQKSVEKYLAIQELRHSKFTFQQEFLILLKKHHVEYDEKYIWD
jgi:REP element-mobilizing transposase RayT